MSCDHNDCGRQPRPRRCLMRYASTKENMENKKQTALNEREPDSRSFFGAYSSTRKGNMMKRVLILLVMTISLVFAGAQSTPTAKAGAGCELVCGEPYIDPVTGQCFQDCCPQDPACMRPCVTVQCNP